MKTTPMTEKLYDYVIDHNFEISPVLKKVNDLTQKRADRNMQIPVDQGDYLYQCIKMMNPKRVVEVGTFTGYSSICMASALSEGSKLYSIDMDPETQKIAQDFLNETPARDKVQYICKTGVEGMESLLSEFGESSFDFIF